MAKTYPISLVLAGKPAVVVGGGEVATRKVNGLLVANALVTVVAPGVTDEIQKLARDKRCVWKKKTYEYSDLAEACLVFACTNDGSVNKRIFEDATEQRLWVNVADVPELCTFYLPSVLRRDKLSIAVSTEGSSPQTAKRIREHLEEHIDEEIGEYLDLLQAWRERLMLALPANKRQLFWERASEGTVYDLVKQGDAAKAEAELERLLGELS